MQKDVFLEALKAYRKIDVFDETLNQVGLEFFNTDCYDSICKLERLLFTEAYGTEGYEWIEWYLTELPDIKKDDIKKDGKERDHYAEDGDGNPIYFNTDEDLYNFLEKEYKKNEQHTDTGSE